MENKRGSFGSNFGFLMAAVGSAVGLGNIWGFSYKMGVSGGFPFLLIYVLLAIFVGVAVMLGEFAIGRMTGQSPVGAYKALSKKFTWLGYAGVITGFCILCFYFVLGGMVTRYAVGYLLAMFGMDTWGVSNIGDFFGHFICNGTSMMIYFAVFVIINVAIVAAGVGSGIEKFCKYGMPALFVMLLIILIYVAVQPGAGEGYKYMFAWNMQPLQEDFLGVLKLAAGQMFFSLSLGMGCMITYGSYLSKQENLQKNAVIVTICDTSVAIMAGMIILPACAAFGIDYAAGPGLLFQSMQVVFDSMGGFIGNLMGFLFYSLTFIAALSSSISILEVCTSYQVDKNIAAGKAPGRKKASIVFSVVIFIFGSLVALDALGTGSKDGAPIAYPAELLGIDYAEADITEFAADTQYYTINEDGSHNKLDMAATTFSADETYYVNTAKGWNDCWLDFYDMISEGILMPLGALMMSFLIGWVWKIDLVVKECDNCGKKFWGRTFFDICYKFITPIGMAFVLYAQITGFFG